jgi:hypothetical protein
MADSGTIIAALAAEANAANATSAAFARRATMAGGLGKAGMVGIGAMGVHSAAQSESGGYRVAGGALSGAIAGSPWGLLGAGVGAVAGGAYAYLGGLANGRTGGRAGTAMVGERGPEMVSLPQGSNVVSNENIGRMMAVSARSSQEMSQMTNALKSSLDNLSSKLNSVITLDERKADRDRGNVIRLELDGRVLSETVVDYINEQSEISLTS